MDSFQLADVTDFHHGCLFLPCLADSRLSEVWEPCQQVHSQEHGDTADPVSQMGFDAYASQA